MILTGFMMVILTICMYVIARYIQNKFNYSILNPALIASLAIIFILIICGLDYKDYMIGSQRSEERRVGNECQSGLRDWKYKKKKCVEAGGWYDKSKSSI